MTPTIREVSTEALNELENRFNAGPDLVTAAANITDESDVARLVGSGVGLGPHYRIENLPST